MGIKLTYQQINSQELNQALGLLSMQNGFSSFQAGYNVARIIRQFQKELKIARDAYSKWTEEYLVKGEDGKPKPASTPHPFCPFEVVPEKLEEFNKKMDDFLKVEVDIQSHPIRPEDLGTVKLSPQQILALEPVMVLSAFEPESAESQKV